jgi:uncharacterized protein (TIGR02118 family)
MRPDRKESAMIKLTLLYGHPKDPQEFERYYAEKHLPLAAKMKGVDRLELTRFRPGPDSNKPAHYRMAELYFPTEVQMQSTLSSAEGQTAVADLKNFTTGGVTILMGSVER